MSKTVSGEAKARLTIKVIAIGHGAINAQNHMIDCGMQGVDFIAIGSDAMGLKFSKAPNQILLGENRPLGLGMLPMPVCRELAEKARDIIKRNLDGSDIVFVVACMGGNTGSGASSVVASCAREIGALTIAVITTPLSFEGKRRCKRAEKGIDELKENVNAFITISNDSLLKHMDNMTVATAFQVSDDALYRSVQQVYDLLSIPGIVNIDFRDINLQQTDSVRVNNEELMGLPRWMPRSNSDKGQEKAEDLVPRTDGKEVCAYLRSIRIDLAKANNIPFASEPCNFNGDCAGTCEKCDQEAAYLRDELSKIPEKERKYPKHTLKDWKTSLCLEK